ncbi:MAG: hypothetical protein VYC76_02490, partial [Pseudomonadota bacterium]|nr:hypothetical protein [Pseudomonadota bacterium]
SEAISFKRSKSKAIKSGNTVVMAKEQINRCNTHNNNADCKDNRKVIFSKIKKHDSPFCF